MIELYHVTTVVLWAAMLAILYWVIRLAVRHAIRDADKRPEGPRP